MADLVAPQGFKLGRYLFETPGGLGCRRAYLQMRIAPFVGPANGCKLRRQRYFLWLRQRRGENGRRVRRPVEQAIEGV
jgi:hypothetical protein